MRFLLDTHVFLWFITDDPRLSGYARTLIEDELNERLLSIASIWEIAIKVSIGKLPLTQSLETFLPDQMRQNGITPLPLELSHVYRVSTLPVHHRDPFDRLLVAQCLIEQLPLLSADQAFDSYGIQRIW